MALYEAVFIARQDLTAENVDSLSDKLSDIITSMKGKIISKEYWGLRNFAYKINKSSKGHYVALNIESENEGIEEFKRIAKLNEDVVRSNIFRTEEHENQPSWLMISVNAKDYKPTESRNNDHRSAERKMFDDQIEKIIINN